MTIQLVSLDMDGTTLNSALTLTARTIQTINEAIDAGVNVVICTGRTLSELTTEIAQLNRVQFIITGNGSAIWDMRTREKIYENPLSYTDVQQIMAVLSKYDMRIEPYIEDQVYISTHCYNNLTKYGAGTYLDFIYNSRKPVAHIEQLIETWQKPIDKFNLFFLTSEERQQVWDELVQKGFAVTSSFLQNMEVNAMTANKGTALKQLVKHLNVQQNEVLAVGDALNDLSMLIYAGHPVAMGNAKQEVKDVAVYITKTNDEDGVAHAIDHFVFERV